MKNQKFTIDQKVIPVSINTVVTVRDAKTGKIKRVHKYHNLVTSAAKALIAEFLGSSTPSVTSISPNFCAVGSGTNAPSLSDTTLQTEMARTVVASKSFSGAVAYLTGFFGATDVSGTIKEVGLLMNATASSPSGTLFNRVAINVTKSLTETLTIDFTITIS